MNLFTKHCAAALFFAATITFQSCNDHDFDWEEAHRQNAEYNYEQNFAQVFGEINPNQNWDFSGWNGVVYQGTRGDGDEAEVTFVTKEQLATQWSSTPYEVDGKTVTWFGQQLPEFDQENRKKGASFSLVMPDNSFKITPIYQGGNSCNDVEVHMVVTYGTKSEDYTIWKKGEHIEHRQKSSNKTFVKPNDTDGTTTGSSGNWSVPSYKIQGYPLTINKVDFPAGALITFYSKATIDESYDCKLCEKSGTNKGKVYNEQTKTYETCWICGGDHRLAANDKMEHTSYDENHPRILALTTCPIPDNLKDHKTDDIQNGVMLIACEAGGDTDMNDVIFLIEGEPYLPKVRETTGIEHKIKRYMVEDMGYSDPSSTAVAAGYTDIDFNDIVIDLDKYRAYKDYFNGGEFVRREYTEPNWHYSAKVRALGGTWDFKLYVDDSEVFHKHNAAQIEKNSDGTITGQPGPGKVDFNKNYKINNVSINGLVAGKMYNTGNDYSRNDGNFPTTTAEFQTSYICELTATGIQNWNPETNNIKFVIQDVADFEVGEHFYDSFDSSTDPNNVYFKAGYTLNFPKMGETPKIIAFDPTKTWQREKVHVTTEWFKSK